MAREELDFDEIMADVEVTLSDPEGNKSVVILVDALDAFNVHIFLTKEAEFEFAQAKERGIEVDIYNDFWAVLNDKFENSQETIDEETSLVLLELTGRDVEFIGRKLIASREIYEDPYESYLHIYDEFVKEGGRPEQQVSDYVFLMSKSKIPFQDDGPNNERL